MSEELKACPFCGGEAKMCSHIGGSAYEGSATVTCVDCDATVGSEGDYHNCIRPDKDAIEKWNTRKPNV